MVIIMRQKSNPDSDKLNFKPIGAAMRRARHIAGLTQEKASEELGIQQQHYQRLETTGKYPGINLFYKIVRLYHLSVDELFYPEEAPKKSSVRKQLDYLLDKLDEGEIMIIVNLTKSLLNSRKQNKQGN